MPRNMKNSESTDDYVLPTFVPCELSDDERTYCKANLLSFEEAFTQIDDLVADGYKLSFSYDERSDCASAFLTATSKQRTNGGQALSARGPHTQAALTVLLYKHFTKLKEHWADNKKAAAKDNWG